MDKQLIQDTIDLLLRQIDPDAAINIHLHEDSLKDIVSMLHTFHLTRARKMTILGGYMLLQLAVRRHRELAVYDRHLLIRSILDGDYFTGLYFRFLARYSEYGLLAFLAPVHKQIQIGMIYGKSVDQVMTEVVDRIRLYLDEHCR